MTILANRTMCYDITLQHRGQRKPPSRRSKARQKKDYKKQEEKSRNRKEETRTVRKGHDGNKDYSIVHFDLRTISSSGWQRLTIPTHDTFILCYRKRLLHSIVCNDRIILHSIKLTSHQKKMTGKFGQTLRKSGSIWPKTG